MQMCCECYNPQRWNLYAYAVNNPLFYKDPDGRDAIAVGFKNQVPFAGHAGVISVHRDGTANYACSGPARPGVPIGRNKVEGTELPPVQFGSNNLPTPDSLRTIAEAVAEFENQYPSSVTLAYFRTSEAETLALDLYFENERLASERHKLLPYLVLGNNCADFCINQVMQSQRA
jgi:hypothetical protein